MFCLSAVISDQSLSSIFSSAAAGRGDLGATARACKDKTSTYDVLLRFTQGRNLFETFQRLLHLFFSGSGFGSIFLLDSHHIRIMPGVLALI
jgi:hypothetical protein